MESGLCRIDTLQIVVDQNTFGYVIFQKGINLQFLVRCLYYVVFFPEYPLVLYCLGLDNRRVWSDSDPNDPIPTKLRSKISKPFPSI